MELTAFTTVYHVKNPKIWESHMQNRSSIISTAKWWTCVLLHDIMTLYISN